MTVLAVLAWWALAVVSLVLVFGPISLPAVGLSISDPTRPAVAALTGIVAAWQLARRTGARPDVSVFHYATIAGTILLTVIAIATCGVTSVGGSDSAGYLAQAQRWRDGHVRVAVPLAVPGLRDGTWAQSGLGFRPAPEPGLVVPSYPPGLPWIEAVAQGVGGDTAAIRVVPLVAAVVALLALVAVARPLCGLAGASVAVAMLASSAPFLYQSFQPMSDVPALAGWLLALHLAGRSTWRSLVTAALAAFVVILVRPNLAPLLLPVGWQALRGSGRTRGRALVITVCGAVAVAIVAALQAWLFGSPSRSGYGSGSELFSLANVGPNVARFSTWMTEVIGLPSLVLVAAGVLALAWKALRQPSARPALLMLVLTVALYLVYIPFDNWTYLRFILIALAIAPIGAAQLVTSAHDRLPALLRVPFVIVLLLGVVLPNLQRAQAHGVFAIRRVESRYRLAGHFVRDTLPANTVLLAGQHSTSAPYYSGRPALRADLITADELDIVSRWAQHEGRTLVFVLDADEAQRLRQQWATTALGQLDWVPRAAIGRPVGTYIWVAADREAYLAGAPLRTVSLAER